MLLAKILIPVDGPSYSLNAVFYPDDLAGKAARW